MTQRFLENLIMNFYLIHLFSRNLTNKWKKDFKNLSRDHLKLKKTLQHQVEISLDAFTQICGACMTLKEMGPSYVLRLRQVPRKKLFFLKNSEVGKQIERSSKWSEEAEWTSWLSKGRKIWIMERMCTTTLRLWRSQNE